jgi:hypothetical protein
VDGWKMGMFAKRGLPFVKLLLYNNHMIFYLIYNNYGAEEEKVWRNM